MAQFDAGDFVTNMDVRRATPTKLSVLWKGPAQVEEAVSPFPLGSLSCEIWELAKCVKRMRAEFGFMPRTLMCLKRHWRMSHTMIKDTWSRNCNSAVSTKTQKLMKFW
jgi:hypothetical protein